MWYVYIHGVCVHGVCVHMYIRGMCACLYMGCVYMCFTWCMHMMCIHTHVWHVCTWCVYICVYTVSLPCVHGMCVHTVCVHMHARGVCMCVRGVYVCACWRCIVHCSFDITAALSTQPRSPGSRGLSFLMTHRAWRQEMMSLQCASCVVWDPNPLRISSSHSVNRGRPAPREAEVKVPLHRG